jgi:hypothetical protein
MRRSRSSGHKKRGAGDCLLPIAGLTIPEFINKFNGLMVAVKLGCHGCEAIIGENDNGISFAVEVNDTLCSSPAQVIMALGPAIMPGHFAVEFVHGFNHFPIRVD